MARRKLTGYFIEDHADIMARLKTGTATPDDQKKILAELQEADLHADVYNNLTSKIEPYVCRITRPDGTLPSSVCDSMDILLEFWLKHRSNPALQEGVMAMIRKALTVGTRYSLTPCVEALAKLDAEEAAEVAQRYSRAYPNSAKLSPGFPLRLQAARQAAGMSVEELAERVYQPPKNVERYELGTMVPQTRTINRIVNVLHTSLAALTRGEPVEPPTKVSLSFAHMRGADEDSE